ncbi:T9SS type A sorting domain-containing protein [Hanstruepera marina]|uniref:T9SS type A sorting domain-containing protein n=1 Tax=Hanstruepera marina TaxID=2873265 RepID=UPI001CA68810|nr:T9SS type A sorting domain-containing protein [Hanstruepera marina]
MKKTTYLLGILLVFQAIAYAQYTAIPDAVFEQALINFGYDSEGVLDGQILTADAAAATGTLGLANQGITNITGIEAFTGIDELNMNYNPINVAVDLSSNTQLTHIKFEGCTPLPGLNVSGLTSLQIINIFGTAITSLDVSTNSGLTQLQARNAGITSLDLSSNTLISSVDVRNNALTSLDVRNGNMASSITYFNSDLNPNLTCIFVEDSSDGALGSWIVDAGSTFVETEGECATLSRESNSISQFNVYPNPATTQITVASTASKGQIQIFNITGKRVLSKDLSLGDNRLNVSSLVSGVYLARINANGKTETKKLIIN